jgi:hypothetical protein
MSDHHAWTVIDLLIVFGPVVFFLPTLIVFLRSAEQKEMVFLVNMLALVTCGMAWFVALFYAFRFPGSFPELGEPVEARANQPGGTPTRYRWLLHCPAPWVEQIMRL